MQRTLLTYLKTWINSPERKPLIIRGARQVGKTWIARQIAKSSNKTLIELNFEKNPNYLSLFNTNEPKQILVNLSAATNHPIDIENALLFLDEIQAAPELLAKLRWFAEDLPQLAIIAAGSLLEFILEDHNFSMPVGRINYVYLEPLSFQEFLLAKQENTLHDYLSQYELKQDIPEMIHNKLMNLFKEYIVIGGMPAAVSNWIKNQSLQKINQIQQDLLATYRDDFAKYTHRLDKQKLDETMMAIPKMLGEKFVYKHVNPHAQAQSIKNALNLLTKARISNLILSTAANGIPLSSEVNEKFFKVNFLDTGLCCACLGLGLTQINDASEINMINNGGIAEQIVGQLLRSIEPPYIQPHLYYWLRTEKQSNAEIDYVIQHHNQVIPIEVKAGATGSLKSLHAFMNLKKYSIAVRINADMISAPTDIQAKNHQGIEVKYKLLSIPFYLTEQVHRLLDQLILAHP